ncbi:hypothetical protein, conserved, partial [Eimeria necatrix]
AAAAPPPSHPAPQQQQQQQPLPPPRSSSSSSLFPPRSSSSSSSSSSRMQGLGGGRVYWGLRLLLQQQQRRCRRLGRVLDLNWDFGKAAMAGTPKFSFDPAVNQWTTAVDNELWNGPGGIVWSSFSMNCCWWAFWAFWVYFTITRWHVNGKMDTFAKWKQQE